MFSPTFVCSFICQLAGSRKNYSTDFQKISVERWDPGYEKTTNNWITLHQD